MATVIAMKHKDTGITKDGYYGFSWTTFLFGFFPALFRCDFITFIGGLIITGILGIIAVGITGDFVAIFLSSLIIYLIWAFMYNKYYTRKLLEQGYVFAAGYTENTVAAKALGVELATVPTQEAIKEDEFCSDEELAIPDTCPNCGAKQDPEKLVMNDFMCTKCKFLLPVPCEVIIPEKKTHPEQISIIKKEHEPDTMECPMCAEIIKSKAKKCRYCGYFLVVEG